MADKWHDSDRHWSNIFTLDQSQRVLESRADTSDYILSHVLVLTVIVSFVSITRSLRMPSQQYSMRSPAVKRLMKEAQELHEPNELYHAQPLEDNLFEWHFTIRGPGDSEFGGGIYHGRIILPPDYPMKPPSVILLTPNGRFEVYKKICLSISGHHPESWQPSWSIRTALLAIIGFMPTHGNGAIGSLDYKPEERKKLAKKSTEFKCPSCGLIKDLLLPETEASKAASEEAKELAAQIDFQAEKKGSTSQASNSADSSSSDGSKQDTTQPSSNPQTTQASPFNMSQFNPMMFAMPGMIPRPNTSSGSTSPSQIPPPPYFNPMLMRPPGGMQLPPGITQMPQGFPQLPQGFPQMPQGFPQMPQGFPQMPQGFPPMPQGFPPRFWMNQPTAAATGTSEQTLQGITSQSLTSAAVTSTSTANSVQPSSSLSSPSSRESPVPTVSPVTSQNLTSQASQSRSTVSSPSLSSPAAAAAPCPSSATSKASSMATATSTTDSGASIEASETSTSATGPSPSLASSPNTSSSPASGLRHRQSSNTPSRTQSSAGTRQPTTQRPPQSNGNTTFVLTVVVALAIALLIFRRLLYMNVFDYAFSEPEH